MLTTTTTIGNLVRTHFELGGDLEEKGKGIRRGQPRELSATADSGEDSGEGARDYFTLKWWW